MRNNIKNNLIIIASGFMLLLGACNSVNTETTENTKTDSIATPTTKNVTTCTDTAIKNEKTVSSQNTPENTMKTGDQEPKVLIYSFHITNRCPSCIAIESATKKTLDQYFKSQVDKGQIKLSVLNVDDEANKKISEKYEAFGSGLFITRVYKNKETTADMTGTGFKYARNKEEKFIELLKNQLTEYLKL